MLCTASEYMKTLSTIASAVLVRICCLVINVNTSENKSNTSRKRESIPLSLYSSPRGLGFHFEPGFSVSANCLMMFWETESGHIKIMKKLFTCHSVAILLYCMGKNNFAWAIMSSGILVWLTTWRKKSN